MQTKIVIFDYDGTLTKTKKGGNCWLYIWQLINATDEDEYHYNKYRNHEYADYKEWLFAVIESFKKHKVNRQMMTEIASSSCLVADLEFVFKQLCESGISIYVLSGGIKNIIELNLKNLSKYIKSIEAYGFKFDNDGIICDVDIPNHCPENKQEFINRVIKEENILPNQVLFVGNGENDETASLTGVRTLCFNPDDAHFLNKEIWHDVIWSNSMKDILKFVENSHILTKDSKEMRCN